MENSETETAKEVERCMVCSTALTVVNVHGHYQCVTCGAVTSECCNGERADNDQKV